MGLIFFVPMYKTLYWIYLFHFTRLFKNYSVH